MTKHPVFYMAGTEGTGKYLVLAITSRGRLGIRVLDGDIEAANRVGAARIRVEPSDGPKTLKQMAAQLDHWKKPGDGGQHRFSTVVDDSTPFLEELALGLSAIGAGSLKTRLNPDAPSWARDLAAA